jgi:iron complex transport system substrate-binding protein
VWNALSAVPAVRTHRIYFLFDDRIVVPGPRLVDGLDLMARTLHPEAFR